MRLLPLVLLLMAGCSGSDEPGKMVVDVDLSQCSCSPQRAEVFLLRQAKGSSSPCLVESGNWQGEGSLTLGEVVPEEGESYSAAVAVFCADQTQNIPDQSDCCDQLQTCVINGATGVNCENLSDECQAELGTYLNDPDGYNNTYCSGQTTPGDEASCVKCSAVQQLTVADGQTITLAPQDLATSLCDPDELLSLVGAYACDAAP